MKPVNNRKKRVRLADYDDCTFCPICGSEMIIFNDVLKCNCGYTRGYFEGTY